MQGGQRMYTNREWNAARRALARSTGALGGVPLRRGGPHRRGTHSLAGRADRAQNEIPLKFAGGFCKMETGLLSQKANISARGPRRGAHRVLGAGRAAVQVGVLCGRARYLPLAKRRGAAGREPAPQL